MSSVAEKLTAIYDCKNQIRQAIIHKGGTLEDKAPLSAYPQAIYDIPVITPSESTHDYSPNPAWWDIKTIIANDAAPTGYKAVCIVLMAALYDIFSPSTWCDAYRTSDGATYLNNTTKHSWNKEKDKESGDGYSTRYVIYYIAETSKKFCGELLFQTATSEKQFWESTALGIVLNVPMVFSWESQNSMIQVKEDGANSNKYAYYLSSSVANELEYIDVTATGKMVVMDGLFRSPGGGFALYASVKKLPPIYDLPTVFKELAPSHTINYLNNESTATYASRTNTLGSSFSTNGTNFKTLEMYIPNKISCASESPDEYYYEDGLLPLGHINADNAVPHTVILHFVDINADTAPVFTTYTVKSYVPIVFCAGGLTGSTKIVGVNVSKLVIDNPSGEPWYIFTDICKFNGLPISQLTDLLLNHFPVLTSTRTVYITKEQYDALASDVKSTLTLRNYTLAVL